MFAIGTAGHIDHGKSAIVKRLTGTDPDRLPEEKARGMTIDLGFAFYKTRDNVDIAFVDVPGHERFVRNMIAGAGGIDAVILVVAADDGWMPQSEEHFQITRLLGVKHGLVVINKIDLVEPDWLELLEADIRDKLAGSFLEDATVCPVSAHTGEGFDKLNEQLGLLTRQLGARSDTGTARLYIDRSFIRPGIGGVVTGTLRGSQLSVGQTVSVWPAAANGKVRTLQSAGSDVQSVGPGQRTAISLTGVEREHLIRGGVITSRTDLSFFEQNPVLSLCVELMPNSPVVLRNRRRLLLIVGTTEVEGELRILDKKSITPGQQGVMFFRPDNPVYTLVGDRFIVRLPTPMVTLGGGVILDHHDRLPRQKESDELLYLQDRLSVTAATLLSSELKKLVLVRQEDSLTNADVVKSDVAGAIDKAVADKTVLRFKDYLCHPDSLSQAASNVKRTIEDLLSKSPHLRGVPLDGIAQKLRYSQQILEVLLEYMIEQGTLNQVDKLFNIAGRGTSLKGVIKEAHDKIISELKEHPYDPPPLSQLAAGGKINQQAIKYILDNGEAYKCGSSFLFSRETWEEVTNFINDWLDKNRQLTVADLRKKFGFTRKFAIPILEETDRLGLTLRNGDFRIKGD